MSSVEAGRASWYSGPRLACHRSRDGRREQENKIAAQSDRFARDYQLPTHFRARSCELRACWPLCHGWHGRARLCLSIVQRARALAEEHASYLDCFIALVVTQWLPQIRDLGCTRHAGYDGEAYTILSGTSSAVADASSEFKRSKDRSRESRSETFYKSSSPFDSRLAGRWGSVFVLVLGGRELSGRKRVWCSAGTPNIGTWATATPFLEVSTHSHSTLLYIVSAVEPSPSSQTYFF